MCRTIGQVDGQQCHVVSMRRVELKMSSSRLVSLSGWTEEDRVHREEGYHCDNLLTTTMLLSEGGREEGRETSHTLHKQMR